MSRHNVVLAHPDISSPLTLGNGALGFTVDVTGLQTFAAEYEAGAPLGTFSQWGWHSFPNQNGYRLEEVLSNYDSHGRSVPYADSYGENSGVSSRVKAAVEWLRANPHRLDLARVGLSLRHSNGVEVALSDLTHVHQELDLWTGQIYSQFQIDDVPVRVTTICDPARDVLAFRVSSGLVKDRRLKGFLAFPYAAGGFGKAADWTNVGRHSTHMTTRGNRAQIRHTLDQTSYVTSLLGSVGARFAATDPHCFSVSAPGQDVLELTVAFSSQTTAVIPSFAAVQAAAIRYWQEFWTEGGVIDLSGSTDPRAPELERRIVLSEYLTATNSSGILPPQETGLEMDSWYGKFHLEMYWWHAAHFALWNRPELLERSMPWYGRILSFAKQTARRQGYQGARWPKMVGPEGRESPSDIGDFLIWQQPHPIYLAELLYRAHRSRQILQRYQQIVFETADFMASYAFRNEDTHQYTLGPPLIPAQESYGGLKAQVENPTFELAYWQWALDVAQHWRERLGLSPNPAWENVSRGMALPHVRNGVYSAIAVPPFTIRTDHPSMLCALGMLPATKIIDETIMRRTLHDVLDDWDWPSTWGWDYPMMAMTAVRLGEPEKAIDILLMNTPKNSYVASGNNYQTQRLPVYLPGNGGLLYAVAMMAAGWDNGPQKHAPGFPDNGKWHVQFERLSPSP